MPLNPSTYLEGHGWEGKGVPLDGKQGRGLKKPLALPQKRNLRGLGKDRDRAVEWWDCLFEASAKSINIQVGGDKATASSVVDAVKSVKIPVNEKVTGEVDKKVEGNDVTGKLSLVSQAKRDYARKMLMSGFVRGKEIEKSEEEKKLEQALIEQEAKPKRERQGQEGRAQAVIRDDSINTFSSVKKPSKEERAKAKEAKRKKKEEKKKIKEAKKAKTTAKVELKLDKKRKREDKGEKGDKEERRKARAENKKRKVAATK